MNLKTDTYIIQSTIIIRKLTLIIRLPHNYKGRILCTSTYLSKRPIEIW